MPFGRDALPSVVYGYDVVAIDSESRALAHEQLRAAHRYRNRLVEIELARRERVDVLVRELSPQLPLTEQVLSHVSEHLDALRQRIKSSRAASRRRTRPDPTLKRKIAWMRPARRELAAERKSLRAACFASAEFHAAQKVIDEEDLATRKRARHASGLAWGNYLTVEQSMSGCRSGRPPKFRRYDRGLLQVQLQKGLSPEKILAGDRRVSLNPTGRRLMGGPVYRCALRLSATHGTIECDVVLHRDLPTDCKVQWVQLTHRKVATHDAWKLQFVCARAQGWDRASASGETVAVNIGWRLLKDGIRAAKWAGSDGREGEFLLDLRQVGRIGEAESLASIRAKNFDAIKLVLRSWLDRHDAPDWLTERTATLAQWRSEARLAAMAIQWRGERFDGDQKIFAEVEAWRKQDKHLYEWQANTRRKFRAWRKDLYRTAADQLAREYGRLLIADVPWKKMQDKPAAEESDELRAARQRKRIVAPHELQQTLLNRFGDHEKLPAKHLTQTCDGCGQRSGTPDPTALYHTCRHCGETYDQDRNHCLRLLASGRVAADV